MFNHESICCWNCGKTIFRATDLIEQSKGTVYCASCRSKGYRDGIDLDGRVPTRVCDLCENPVYNDLGTHLVCHYQFDKWIKQVLPEGRQK